MGILPREQKKCYGVSSFDDINSWDDIKDVIAGTSKAKRCSYRLRFQSRVIYPEALEDASNGNDMNLGHWVVSPNNSTEQCNHLAGFGNRDWQKAHKSLQCI